MDREIGGFFELERFCGVEYYEELIPLNTARNALAYLIRVKKIKKLYIPFYLCDSVSNVCEREGCVYEYYNIDKDFLPKFNKVLCKDEYLYIVNYFGFLNKNTVKQLKAKYKNIILDNVQAFFEKPIKGIDTIYSCRKFFGVPDGAYLSTDIKPNLVLEIDKSKDRFKHLLGRFEEDASTYYNDFKENDISFDNTNLCSMSKLTQNILRGIDYKKIIKIRNDNYKTFDKELGSINKLNLRASNGPYCYPFYCRNGMEVKKILAKKNIYIATLWPNVLGLDGTLEKDYAENILPLPCDQRYTKEDILRIISEIEREING
ncbi:MAG: hypothetical protein IJY57_03960 [Clostridia bacterium]|nr:hypothetical protein [Clostridia bacterium]